MSGQDSQFSRDGRQEFLKWLGPNWLDLSALLGIPPYERARFPRGDEPLAIWEWLERQRRLGDLPEALKAIGRTDLAGHLTLVTAAEARESPAPTAHEPTPGPRPRRPWLPAGVGLAVAVVAVLAWLLIGDPLTPPGIRHGGDGFVIPMDARDNSVDLDDPDPGRTSGSDLKLSPGRGDTLLAASPEVRLALLPSGAPVEYASCEDVAWTTGIDVNLIDPEPDADNPITARICVTTDQGRRAIVTFDKGRYLPISDNSLHFSFTTWNH
jgi:hypothetical protein